VDAVEPELQTIRFNLLEASVPLNLVDINILVGKSEQNLRTAKMPSLRWLQRLLKPEQ